ncbi:hypothetical protein [Natrinema sp. DC36]|uniref:hypothetical protein n=1 Tax=Natrinema sp. DC36 TaxID=2878680 RepID=UPI001CF02F75|nr:hypothetical protein [Natrinema sp. DC36]
MYFGLYLVLVVIALGSTFLAFYRFDTHVELPLLVAMASWSFLLVGSGEVVVVSNGETITMASQSMQALCLFLAAICGFALGGAVFGVYPTESMKNESETE